MDSNEINRNINRLRHDAIMLVVRQRYGRIYNGRSDILTRISFRVNRGEPLEQILTQCVPESNPDAAPGSRWRAILQFSREVASSALASIANATSKLFRRG